MLSYCSDLQVNIHEYSQLAKAPLLPVLAALTSFFSSFKEPAISHEAGIHVAATYASLPFESTSASEPQQFADAFAVSAWFVSQGCNHR